MKPNLSFCTTIYSAFLLFAGCNGDHSLGSHGLTEKLKGQIELEIRQRVDDYFQAKDVEAMLSFWSDSEDFIHAGDGRIYGGYEKWSNWIKNWNREGNIDQVLYFNRSDIHVVVLSEDAAAYTMNFEWSFVQNGETRIVPGSWTYVFRKSDLGWQVVMSNGTHIGFSYDE
jgi:ketosteroid isomerase-like protein